MLDPLPDDVTGHERVKEDDKVPGRGLYTEKARQARVAFVRQRTASPLEFVQHTSFDPAKLTTTIESFLGSVEIPVGVAGPLQIDGTHARGPYYAPIATTEGALIASIARGAYAITMAGGVTTRVVRKRMMRAPVFIFENMATAARFAAWLDEQRAAVKAEAEKHSNHATLTELTAHLFGKAVHVNFVFETGDAAGQNMTTTCTWRACEWILKRIAEQHPQWVLEHFFVEGGLASDKKASFISHITGRGHSARAEVRLPAKVVSRVLKTTPHKFKIFWDNMAAVSAAAGLVGYNVNVANVVAGIFTATGQDIACVHESALASEYVEVTQEGDLYVSLAMPSLVIGTTGGGTGLAHQRECLEMLGCYGPGKVEKLAEIIVGFALALDLSTAAAIAAGHFATAHEKLGRNRSTNYLKLGDFDERFFQQQLRATLREPALVVDRVATVIDHASDGSVLTELTQDRIKKTIGLFPYEVAYTAAGGPQRMRVMVKVKPTTDEVVGAINQVASVCGAELAAEFNAFKYEVGLGGTDRRELGVYRQTDPRFTRHVPAIYGIYENPEREAFVLVEELLTDLELMNSANAVSLWGPRHREAALAGIAECHAMWLGREAELVATDWLGYHPNAERRTRMRRLYTLLAAHAADEFPEWIGRAGYERIAGIVARIPVWWPQLDALPKTLVHNDFNPRNIAFRRIDGTLRLCAYDWELATLNVPQADLVELLAYTLVGDELEPRAVAALADFHRLRLSEQTGRGFDARAWWAGARYAAYDFLVSRVSLYVLAHTFRQYDFLERVFASTLRLIDVLEGDYPG